METPNQPETTHDKKTKPIQGHTKKWRTVVIWLRVVAVLFAGFFFLSQCAMSKPKAKAEIVDSCIKNVPFSPNWQQALQARGLRDDNGQAVAQYCVCMWDEPLQKLSAKQIQSFANISTQERLALLGGEAAFAQRDKQCMDRLSN